MRACCRDESATSLLIAPRTRPEHNTIADDARMIRQPHTIYLPHGQGRIVLAGHRAGRSSLGEIVRCHRDSASAVSRLPGPHR